MRRPRVANELVQIGLVYSRSVAFAGRLVGRAISCFSGVAGLVSLVVTCGNDLDHDPVGVPERECAELLDVRHVDVLHLKTRSQGCFSGGIERYSAR